ncbi:hypothetical protein PTI98_007271 [Pleurotus ostreatus]|nr:hypothetical protein PTI98_007271 [Pleurotus ostreatus]
MHMHTKRAHRTKGQTALEDRRITMERAEMGREPANGIWDTRHEDEASVNVCVNVCARVLQSGCVDVEHGISRGGQWQQVTGTV